MATSRTYVKVLDGGDAVGHDLRAGWWRKLPKTTRGFIVGVALAFAGGSGYETTGKLLIRFVGSKIAAELHSEIEAVAEHQRIADATAAVDKKAITAALTVVSTKVDTVNATLARIEKHRRVSKPRTDHDEQP